MRTWMICAALVLGASSCGFDCEVQGETRPFASCEALQESYDAEQSRVDRPPSGAVLDDLQTCGAAQGCEIR